MIGTDKITHKGQWPKKAKKMSEVSCFNEAMTCPDLECPKCHKPFTAWIWDNELIFTCSNCSEMGFSVEGMDIDENNLPRGSFITKMEWPCTGNNGSDCTETKRMLFIEGYERYGPEKGPPIADGHYSGMQKYIGTTFSRIMEEFC